jgi:protein-L-isoaspartate O-methyltransferase
MSTPRLDHYSLSAEDAYTLLTGEHGVTMQDANSLVTLAARFGEVRVPLESSVLAVAYGSGYYSVILAALTAESLAAAEQAEDIADWEGDGGHA